MSIDTARLINEEQCPAYEEQVEPGMIRCISSGTTPETPVDEVDEEATICPPRCSCSAGDGEILAVIPKREAVHFVSNAVDDAAKPTVTEATPVPAENKQPIAAAVTTATPTDPAPVKPAADYGMFLLAIPVIGTMLIWFWIDGMALIYQPGEKMKMILVATITGTALVASMEASKVGMETSKKYGGTYGPVSWFFLCALLWIVGYPMYLYKRKFYGLENRVIIGLFVVAVFLYSWVTMAVHIDAHIMEIREQFHELEWRINVL